MITKKTIKHDSLSLKVSIDKTRYATLRISRSGIKVEGNDQELVKRLSKSYTACKAGKAHGAVIEALEAEYSAQ